MILRFLTKPVIVIDGLHTVKILKTKFKRKLKGFGAAVKHDSTSFNLVVIKKD